MGDSKGNAAACAASVTARPPPVRGRCLLCGAQCVPRCCAGGAEEVPPGARLLDAGANYGHFLKIAQERYDVEGFDVSPTAVRYSIGQFGVRNRQAPIYDVEAPVALYEP